MTERRWRVLIGSRSFGQAAPEHITQLEAAGCETVRNKHGRAYRAVELYETLADVDAFITGTDELTGEVIHHTRRLKTIAKHDVGLDNIVVLTPHIGGHTDSGLHRMGQITLENCLLALQGKAPHYLANEVTVAETSL